MLKHKPTADSEIDRPRTSTTKEKGAVTTALTIFALSTEKQDRVPGAVPLLGIDEVMTGLNTALQDQKR